MQKLSNSIQLAHCLLKDRLNEAKIIVDATAGNGNDTLFLAQNAKYKIYHQRKINWFYIPYLYITE